MKNIYTRIGLSLIALTPVVSFAAPKTLSDLVIMTVGYLNQALFLIMALATVTFVWNVYKYFIADGGSEKKDAGLYVMYSVIGFFVILSFWGMVKILENTLKLDATRPESIPSSLDFNGRKLDSWDPTTNSGNAKMEPWGATTNSGSAKTR